MDFEEALLDYLDTENSIPNKPVKSPELLLCVHNVLQFMEYHPNTWPKTVDEFLEYLTNFSTTPFWLDPLKIISFLHTAGLCKPSENGISFDKEKLTKYTYQDAEKDGLHTLELIHIKEQEDQRLVKATNNSDQSESDDNSDQSEIQNENTISEYAKNKTDSYQHRKLTSFSNKKSPKTQQHKKKKSEEKSLKLQLSQREKSTLNSHNNTKIPENNSQHENTNQMSSVQSKFEETKTLSDDEKQKEDSQHPNSTIDTQNSLKKDSIQSTDQTPDSKSSDPDSIKSELTLLAFKRVISWLKANIKDLDSIASNAETLFYTLSIISQVRVDVDPQAILDELIKRKFVKVKSNGQMKYNIEPQELNLEQEAKRSTWNKTIYTFFLLMVLFSLLLRVDFFQHLFLGHSKK